ncbi:NAD(P)/FAD-dependent oxidoreductase [Trujillonella endophytica]|uniref:3-phenylpropionate/trans-cinnamate dioxygenase ferredoxin reductase subunit n=1 Tax=Trujillonella endophytica TaxID=673521 RepID=A0A1H8QU17_9ACTN|nr:FAD-dependent oxidoreductase [Trujillella endophytica]SEO57546.1 3-phenylpropionate/trans-cinnamate dioxygenase ferredoxin reductase subunit [Trujillella endophytica]
MVVVDRPEGALTEDAVDHVVIVGAGQAGGDLAASLREMSFAGRITMIGGEDSYPYSRHPLSKTFLREKKPRSELLLRPEETYERFDIDVQRGVRVVSIERENKRVLLDDGRIVDYDALVLATGGSPRTYPDDSLADASNVFYLRAAEHADGLRGHLTPGARLTVIGGGYIGLEVAAVARGLGLEVTVVEREERLLARVTSPVTSAFFAQVHDEEGVVLRTGRSVSSFRVGPDRRLTAVVLDDDTTIETDVCLIGIGLRPDTELAQAAGLEVSDGVLVDSTLRTSDPAIFAIGDVARFPSRDSGETRRLESIPNCTEQARALARTLTGGTEPFDAVPWFWSDQYDMKLQVVGLANPSDVVIVRRDPDRKRGFAVFYLRYDEVCAAEIVSSPRDFAIAKKLVHQRAIVDPGKLADPAVPLKDLLSKATSTPAVS